MPSGKDDRAGPGDDQGSAPDQGDILRGTTLRIYRFMYREGKPLGVHEIQRALNLSSPSISHYHLRKLLQAGLVKEQGGGYVVDKVVFENMVRIRRSLIPFRITYLVFFGTTLAILLTLLRPAQLSALYVFALIVELTAVGIFATETVREMRRTHL